ncbi:hypothetical protein MOQ_000296 [Trypanosoma cruzi marinkellei]|uniref:Ribosomal RNA-processing protein 14/surfeit locus protein 6 C-terminal domain-containing protein n=1 Tax=Trypanosoma cruzi marinkellei TaxID=85056 RepID=K2NNS0_TRYCR|nr:hypothetical protein MOQ_000296 [Trypanosoma cruzi marinkellei]
MGFRGHPAPGTRRTNSAAAAAAGGGAGTGADEIPLNLSFGNFEFEEMKRVGRRGGGVRELATLLRHAKRQTEAHASMLGSEEGLERRQADLLDTAMRRAVGVKVKDDPKRLARALAKRRNKKRSSAKKWAERLEKLQSSVNTVVEDRTMARQAARMRREGKERGKQNPRETKRAPGAAAKKKAKRGTDRKGPTAAARSKKSRQGRK